MQKVRRDPRYARIAGIDSEAGRKASREVLERAQRAVGRCAASTACSSWCRKTAYNRDFPIPPDENRCSARTGRHRRDVVQQDKHVQPSGHREGLGQIRDPAWKSRARSPKQELQHIFSREVERQASFSAGVTEADREGRIARAISRSSRSTARREGFREPCTARRLALSAVAARRYRLCAMRSEPLRTHDDALITSKGRGNSVFPAKRDFPCCLSAVERAVL